MESLPAQLRHCVLSEALKFPNSVKNDNPLDYFNSVLRDEKPAFSPI